MGSFHSVVCYTALCPWRHSLAVCQADWQTCCEACGVESCVLSRKSSNQSMKSTPKISASRLASSRNKFSVFATTPCRGLICFSLDLLAHDALDSHRICGSHRRLRSSAYGRLPKSSQDCHHSQWTDYSRWASRDSRGCDSHASRTCQDQRRGLVLS